MRSRRPVITHPYKRLVLCGCGRPAIGRYASEKICATCLEIEIGLRQRDERRRKNSQPDDWVTCSECKELCNAADRWLRSRGIPEPSSTLIIGQRVMHVY